MKTLTIKSDTLKTNVFKSVVTKKWNVTYIDGVKVGTIECKSKKDAFDVARIILNG